MRSSKELCRILFDCFHANPSYACCAFLAYDGPDTAPDINDFFEDMSIRSERVYYPVIAGNTLSFSGLDEKENVVIFVPYEVFSGKGDPAVTECYKNFIASYPNVEKITGVAFNIQTGAKIDKTALAIVPDTIITEEGILRL